MQLRPLVPLVPTASVSPALPSPAQWSCTLLSCVLFSVALPARAEVDAHGVLRRAAHAIGAYDVKAIRFAGAGTGATFGQAYKPGGPWPKLNYSNFARVADYETNALREDFARSRAEPTGGGAVPLSGEQRLTTFVQGDVAWNLAGPAPAATPVALNMRIHDLWTTPHGFIKAGLKGKATLTWRSVAGKEYAAVAYAEPGRFSAVALIGADFLIERIEARVPHPVMGDTPVVTHYSDYREHRGAKFPARIRQSTGGMPTLDIEVKEVEINPVAAIQTPEVVRSTAQRVTTEKAAEGVWYLAGASHHSVAIEMKDHLIVVESPLYDGRAAAMLEVAGQLVPGKAVRYVVNSHPHFDHAGGLRTAAAAGATLVVHASAKPYLEKVFANPNRIEPDLLARSGKKARFIGVDGKQVFSDGTRSVEIHAIRDSVHSAAFLMVYLPVEKLLVEADAYTPGPPGGKPPSPPNANHVNLVDNIERLKLNVERILPLHGRIVPLSELYAAIGRKP